MGLEEGKVGPAEKGRGKIRIGIPFEQSPKGTAGTALGHPQPAEPFAAVAFKNLCPPVESASADAERVIYAGQAMALAKAGIKHAEDEKEAVPHVRNYGIEQNGMGMAAGRAPDPRHPNPA